MEQESDRAYDVIIVGLGCVGLSAAYYCSKKGLKVLGLEMNSISGEIGTSSHGYTRIYRLNDPSPIKNEMMITSLSMWKEVEKELTKIKENAITSEEANLQCELLTSSDILTYGSLDAPFIAEKRITNPEEKWITAQEISEKYPALKNLPEDFIGSISSEAGQVRAENALKGFSFLARKYGANLLYNSEVDKVFKDHVILKNEKTYYANSVVV